MFSCRLYRHISCERTKNLIHHGPQCRESRTLFAPEKLRSFTMSGVNLPARRYDDDGRRTPSYIFVFPTIRSRSDLQTSCSECTRRRWLRGSIAERLNRSTFIQTNVYTRSRVRLRLSTTSPSYRLRPHSGLLSDGRMESSKFELIDRTLS